MRIEVLYFEGCPNSAEACQRTEVALAALGWGKVAVHMREMRTAEDTKGTPFAGSPTISVDGRDIFPGANPASDLSCRIYQTPNGVAGLPTVDQLKEALINTGL
ncbi:alkylmercury lyase [Arthrobacter sp. Soil736]|uniref:DF family (seleno)protein n=1 Tax=Arthrobacter sp. Soil736 TaxID=1736395 RepID=UPI00070156AD|nr:hypothetical protein [Arthrobacter sp. Soil736]KRE63872.1 alkylmercury lyase [Arthrobacter sp. Soil736]